MRHLPCFLCGKWLRQRTDKNKKPYFVCDPCGTQIFIRRKQGIENLQELERALRDREMPIREHSAKLFEIRAILVEIAGVKREIEKLDSFAGALFGTKEDKATTEARKILRERLKTLLGELQRVSEDAGAKN